MCTWHFQLISDGCVVQEFLGSQAYEYKVEAEDDEKQCWVQADFLSAEFLLSARTNSFTAPPPSVNKNRDSLFQLGCQDFIARCNYVH